MSLYSGQECKLARVALLEMSNYPEFTVIFVIWSDLWAVPACWRETLQNKFWGLTESHWSEYLTKQKVAVASMILAKNQGNKKPRIYSIRGQNYQTMYQCENSHTGCALGLCHTSHLIFLDNFLDNKLNYSTTMAPLKNHHFWWQLCRVSAWKLDVLEVSLVACP